MDEKGKSLREKTFGLRFVLSLVFGCVFLGCLIGLIAETIGFFVEGSGSVSYYMGDEFARLITAVVIFGGLHLWLETSVKKSVDEPYQKYQKVLSIIYSVVWCVVGIVGVFVMVSELMNLALGFAGTDEEVLTNVFTGLTMLIISAAAVIEQMRLIPKLPKDFYLIFMSGISMVTIVLFLVFPAQEARNVAYDNKLEADLYSIDDAIDDYNDDYGKLPNNLSDLGEKYVKNLNFDLSKYDYKKISRTSYELCAEFKTSTIDGYGGSYYTNSAYYYRHDKGRHCFNPEVSSSYRRWATYDDYDENDTVIPTMVE